MAGNKALLWGGQASKWLPSFFTKENLLLLLPIAVSWLDWSLYGEQVRLAQLTYVSPDLTGLFSAVTRAVKWFCKSTSGNGGSLFLLLILAITKFYSFVLLVLLPSVWSWEGVSGWGSTSDCTWNHLSNSSAFLVLHSLLSASCSSDTCCKEVLHLGILSAGRSATCPCHKRKSRHFLESEVYTATSPLQSSVWVEVSNSSGVGRVDTPAGAAAFTVRQVTPILSKATGIGTGRVNKQGTWPLHTTFCTKFHSYCRVLLVPVYMSCSWSSWSLALPRTAFSMIWVDCPSLVSHSHESCPL